MKPILPTLKERKRYILFEVKSNGKIGKEAVGEAVINACLQFLGELGVAEAGVQFLPETWKEKEQQGIIRCGHKWVDKVRASLMLIKRINGKKAKIECLKVSGIINKLKR